MNRLFFCLMLFPGILSVMEPAAAERLAPLPTALAAIATEAESRTSDKEMTFGGSASAFSSQGPAFQRNAVFHPSKINGAIAAAYPTFNSELLDKQLDLYLRYVKASGPPHVLIVGSSRAVQGVDPVALKVALAAQGYPKLKVFNFGVNGATAQVVDVLLRKILKPEQLPRMILWADGVRAFNSGRVDRTYNAIVASPGYQRLSSGSSPALSQPPRSAPPSRPNSEQPGGFTPDPINLRPDEPANPGYSIPRRSSNRFDGLAKAGKPMAALEAGYPNRVREVSKTPETLANIYYQRRRVPSRSSETSSPAAKPTPETTGSLENDRTLSGFSAVSARFNPATYYQRVRRVPGEYDGDYASFSLQGQQFAALQSVVAFAKSKRISLVMVNLPLSQDYLDSVRLRHERAFQQSMQRVAGEQGFIFRDLSSQWLTRYDYFADPSHLNVYGAEAVSKQLAQDRTIPWPNPQ